MIPQKYLSSITESFPGLVALYNIQTGKYLYTNKTVTKILGYKPEDFMKGGYEFVSSLVHPEDLPRILKENEKALSKLKSKKNKKANNEPIVNFEYRMRHKNGSYKWLYTEGTIFTRDKKGNPELILNTSLDITEFKIKEIKVSELSKKLYDLKHTEEGFRKFIEVVEDYAILRLDTEGNISSWNAGVKAILGYEEKEIIGKPISILFSLSDQKKGKAARELKAARTKGSYIEDGLRMKKDGTIFFASITTTAIKDNKNKLQGYSKIIRDITERREAEETIKFQALHDTLTGLINRKGLDEHFNNSKTLLNKKKLAVLFLDLDRFKNINDTLGHGIGDSVLKEAGHRI
jgi:PAS domain S-box-containing protein